MTFRYLLVDTSGDVTGTNDAVDLPAVDDSDDIVCIIDTADGTFCNDDEADATIPQFESEDDDSDDSDE